MSKKVIIASDSTCDLSPELIAQYDIKIIPLGVNLGDKLYFDGVNIDSDYIYQHYEATGQLPKTSAANIADFDNLFQKYTAEGNAVVCFTISSEMSSTFNNARIASEEYEDVYVIDTKNLSTGGGLLVLAACDMASQGKSAKEIADTCAVLVNRVDASFVIDNLEFLHKGGRCSSIAAFGANVLQLKPCIIVRDGKMSVGKKYRGKFNASLKKYIADQISDTSGIELERVFITHAGCEDELCEQCVTLVKELAPFKEVLLTRAGCTISSHCGRNTLGVLFIRKKDIE